MSAYIVNNETISAIVKGFEIYGATYNAEGYKNRIRLSSISQI